MQPFSEEELSYIERLDIKVSKWGWQVWAWWCLNMVTTRWEFSVGLPEVHSTDSLTQRPDPPPRDLQPSSKFGR
jgi:hypothetical protein